MSQGHIEVTEQVSESAHPLTEDRVCTVLEALHRISGKWAIGTLLAATPGPTRFTELERAVPGVSRRILTLTLRNLERDGLLERTVYPTVPPRVEYRATPLADELHDALLGLRAWAERNRGVIDDARKAYDARVEVSSPRPVSVVQPIVQPVAAGEYL